MSITIFLFTDLEKADAASPYALPSKTSERSHLFSPARIGPLRVHTLQILCCCSQVTWNPRFAIWKYAQFGPSSSKRGHLSMSKSGLFQQCWIRFNTPTGCSEKHRRTRWYGRCRDAVSMRTRLLDCTSLHHFFLLVNQKSRKGSTSTKDVGYANYVKLFSLKSGNPPQTSDSSWTSIWNSPQPSKDFGATNIVAPSTFPHALSSGEQRILQKIWDAVGYCLYSELML